MTGRPGYRTMEMIGGSSASYLARTPCVPLFCTLFTKAGNRRVFRLPGAGGGSFPLYGGTFARSYSVPNFGGFLRNFGWVFAILFEVLLLDIQEEIHHFACWGGGGVYMREIGTMWQIGVLTGKPCTFLVQNGSFSAFGHYKNKERLSRGLDVKWHIPSTCLDASESGFLLEFTA